MYIKKSLISFVLVFFVAVSVYAYGGITNVGRNVYAIFSNTKNGAHFDAPGSDYDAVRLDKWGEWDANSLTIEDKEEPASQEGRYTVYKRYTWSGASWCGSGVTSINNDITKNMSSYYGGSLKFWARTSSSKVVNSCNIGLKLSGTQIEYTLAKLGLPADGKWHELTIKLNGDITSDMLMYTSLLFIISQSENVVAGDYVDIAYVRYVKASKTNPVFSVLKKDLETHSYMAGDAFSWNSDDFYGGWVCATSYFELDFDDDSSNWSVMLYTDNGDAARNGLYYHDEKHSKDYVMTMCWRAVDQDLPYSDVYGNHTTKIGQGRNEWGDYLYDIGNSSPTAKTFGCWFFMLDVKSTTTTVNKEYATVWSPSGFHGAPGANYYGFSGYDKNPKVYIGANCNVPDFRYTGLVKFVLNYE